MIVPPPPFEIAGDKPRVLLVDDDESFLRANARALRHGYLVATATSAARALEHLREQDIDLAVIDYQLGAGDPDGLALHRRGSRPRARAWRARCTAATRWCP